MHPVHAGVLINSALYLAAVFLAGLVSGNRWAELSAIAAMGVSYLSYTGQVMFPGAKRLNGALCALSAALGLCAGLTLVPG